jgi:hypothetical protein
MAWRAGRTSFSSSLDIILAPNVKETTVTKTKIRRWPGSQFACTNLAPFGQQTTPTYNNLQKVPDGQIIKKPSKYGIVLFWPRPLKAEIRVRIPVSLPEPAEDGL